MLVILTLVAGAGAVNALDGGHLGAHGAVQRSSRHGLSSLPPAAHGPVSAALGADDPSYWIHDHDLLHAVNPAQDVRVAFTRSGVRVSVGGSQLWMALAGAGYGRSLHAAADASPQARANLVRYRRGALSEWYFNGPLGVEQGFTVAHPLDRSGRGPLTLSVSLAGDVRPVLAGAGHSLVFRGVDGRDVLRYEGLAAADARGRPLHTWLSLRGADLRVMVDVRGASYPLQIDPFIRSAALTASDGADSDELGDSVAISGSTIAVGAPGHGVGSHAGQGAVYIFTQPASGKWKNATQTAELTASDGAAGDQLGYSVAIDGPTVVAGAPGARATVGRGGKGMVYVFTQPASGAWKNASQTAELTASDAAAGDEFGSSVAISGKTVAAGAPEHTAAGHGGQGAVYVFPQPASGAWKNATQTAELTASDGAGGDELGFAVAIDGGTIAAAASGHAVASNGQQGAVYVFSAPASGWRSATQTAELTASDGAANDRLGDSVAVSGRTIAAGSMLHGVGVNSEQGAVYVFAQPASGAWKNATQTAELTASDGAAGDDLGYSIALSGRSLVAGAYNHAVSPAGNPGAVYVFTQPASGAWKNASQTAELSASDGADGDEVGYAVAIDGGTIVAGAPEHSAGVSSQQGAAYVFAGPQTSPLVVTNAKQSHNLWRAGEQLPTFAAKRTPIPIGTTFSFALNEPAGVTFGFTQQVDGRRVGAGPLSFTGHAGTNKVFFEGLLSRRNKLRPGRYTLIISATRTGQLARSRPLSFTIVK